MSKFDIPADKLPCFTKREDGFYRARTEDLIAAGFLTEPSVFYNFSHDVVLVGSIPKGVHIMATQRLVIGHKEEATIGQGVIIQSAALTMKNMKISSGASIRSCSRKMELDSCYISADAEVSNIDGFIKLEDCVVDGNVTTQNGWIEILSTQVYGTVTTNLGNIEIRDSLVTGEVCSNRGVVTARNVMVMGKLYSPTRLIDAQNCRFIEGARLHNEYNIRPVAGFTLVEDNQKEPDLGKVDINRGKLNIVIKMLTNLSGVDEKGVKKIRWRVTEADDQSEVYRTCVPVKDPREAVRRINACLGTNIMLPPSGEGYITIPTSSVSERNCMGLVNLDLSAPLAESWKR